MERNETSNGLHLIKIAGIRLKGKFTRLFVGAFTMITPLLLMILVPLVLAISVDSLWILSIGVVLFAICVGPLQVGYIKYYDALMKGKQPRLSLIYSQFRFNLDTLRIMYIAMILLLMYIIGGMLWIVPAGFAISFYSMSLFFYEKQKHHRMTQAMKECSIKMVGNRLSMFSYKLIFYFVYFLLFVVGGASIALIFSVAEYGLFSSWVIGVISAILFILLYTMITVYYHSCNHVFFEDVLIYHEKKQRKKTEEKEKREKMLKENPELLETPKKKSKTKKESK